MQSSLKWNLKLKPSNNTYPEFKGNFGATFIIFLSDSTYDFEFEEVKNPTLQISHDLELKWRRCEQLKRIVQRETKEVSISQDVQNGIELNFIRAKKPMGISFALTCKYWHNHAKTTRIVLKCCQTISISHDHAKLVILMRN